MGHGSGKSNRPSRHAQVATYPDQYAISWGDWQPLEDGSFYRQGQDASGHFYEESQPRDPRVPRTVDQVTSQFNNLSVTGGDSFTDTRYGHVGPQARAQQGYAQSSSAETSGRSYSKPEDYAAGQGSGHYDQGGSRHTRSSAREETFGAGADISTSNAYSTSNAQGSSGYPQPAEDYGADIPVSNTYSTSNAQGSSRYSQPTEDYEPDISTSNAYNHGSTAESYPTTSPRGSSRHFKAAKSEGRKKGKDKESYSAPYEAGNTTSTVYTDQYPTYSTANPVPYVSKQPTSGGYGPHETHSAYHPTGAVSYEDDDAEFTNALDQSRRLYNSQQYPGESSTAVSAQAYALPVDDRAETPKVGSAYSAPKAPQSTYLPPDKVRTYDWFDNRFRVEPTSRFEYGEVFKVLWSEPLGQSSQPSQMADIPLTDYKEMQEANGELFYTGIRRFIVIGTDGGNSICVPILTYGRQGCKKGAKPEKHGIVYSPPHRPRLMPNEPTLGMDSVRLEIYTEGERLARESRVNYSKHVTIEHNWKVLFIGRIYPEDHDLVEAAVNQCWEQRKRTRHERRKHHHHKH